jgi:hypothetical protein
MRVSMWYTIPGGGYNDSRRWYKLQSKHPMVVFLAAVAVAVAYRAVAVVRSKSEELLLPAPRSSSGSRKFTPLTYARIRLGERHLYLYLVTPLAPARSAGGRRVEGRGVGGRSIRMKFSVISSGRVEGKRVEERGVGGRSIRMKFSVISSGRVEGRRVEERAGAEGV